MEPDKKKYLIPILAILFLLLTIVIIPLIVAETSDRHVRKTEPISAVFPLSGSGTHVESVSGR